MWCLDLQIQQVFTSVAYPQSNGQVEIINRELLRGLKIKLDHVGGSWVEEMPSILWAYRMTPRESTRMTPFQLVYGAEAVVPVEIDMESMWIDSYDPENNSEERMTKLNLVEETRESSDSTESIPTTHVSDIQPKGYSSLFPSGGSGLEEVTTCGRRRKVRVALRGTLQVQSKDELLGLLSAE